MARVERWVVVAALVWAAGCSGDGSGARVGREGPRSGQGGGAAGLGGSVGNAGQAGTAGDIWSEGNALTVRIEDVDQLVIEMITLSCAGDCADVMAVATGGNPPYAIRWEDGSTDPARTVCLDAATTLEVRVTDTGIRAEEFSYEPHTVTRELSAAVLDCSDAGAPDASPCEPRDEGEELGELTPDIFSNDPSFFADGDDLPAGRYGVEWVDGCVRYDPLIYFWSVNGSFNFEYWIIGGSTNELLHLAPVPEDLFGQATFDECIALSAMAPPVAFDFAGGKLGMFNNDFKPDDNTPGEGGRNPTFKLTRLARCAR